MKLSKLAAISLLAAASIPATAIAQDAPAAATLDLSAGKTIYGPQGNEVGTIVSVAGGNVVVSTGKNQAALPSSSFTAGEKGATIGFTREQLDSAIEAANQKASAALDAALVAGAEVHSSDGVMLGTVSSVEGDNVLVELESGPASFSREQFVTNEKGLMVRLSAAQVAASLAQAQGGAEETPAEPEGGQ